MFRLQSPAWIAGLVVATVCCGLLAGCPEAGPAQIVGKWLDTDGVVWEFKPDGTIRAGSGAPFKYDFGADGLLKIDYQQTDNLVITYSYELSENKLILRPETATCDGTLPLDWNEETVFVREGTGSGKPGEVLSTDAPL
jgi:hypothetical protein